MAEKIKVGILVSGTGSNMKSIVEKCFSRSVDAKVIFVGADNYEAKGLGWARGHGLPTFVVPFEEYRRHQEEFAEDSSLYREAIKVRRESQFVHGWFGGDRQRQILHVLWKVEAEKDLLRRMEAFGRIDLLVLAGFMQVFTSFLIGRINQGGESRIMNIHPALLPNFPGTKGYEDTFNYGCRVGGCTVHFIDAGEDTGPIIGQRAINILPDETIREFKERGLREEWEIFPECIQLFAKGRLRIVENGSGRKIVKILP